MVLDSALLPGALNGPSEAALNPAASFLSLPARGPAETRAWAQGLRAAAPPGPVLAVLAAEWRHRRLADLFT